MVGDDRLDELIDKDQLSMIRRQGRAFSQMEERLPAFPPTFKFEPGTSDYDMKRRPAWCDRILYKTPQPTFKNMEIKTEQTSYRSHPQFTMSDHKPVSSEFTIHVSWHRGFRNRPNDSLMASRFLPGLRKSIGENGWIHTDAHMESRRRKYCGIYIARWIWRGRKWLDWHLQSNSTTIQCRMWRNSDRIPFFKCHLLSFRRTLPVWMNTLRTNIHQEAKHPAVTIRSIKSFTIWNFPIHAIWTKTNDLFCCISKARALAVSLVWSASANHSKPKNAVRHLDSIRSISKLYTHYCRPLKILRI